MKTGGEFLSGKICGGAQKPEETAFEPATRYRVRATRLTRQAETLVECSDVFQNQFLAEKTECTPEENGEESVDR